VRCFWHFTERGVREHRIRSLTLIESNSLRKDVTKDPPVRIPMNLMPVKNPSASKEIFT